MTRGVPVHMADEPRRTLAQPRSLRFRQSDRRKKWQQPNERAELYWEPLPVRPADEVVVEAVLLIPEAGALAVQPVHRPADGHIVLKELRREIFVSGLTLGQFDRRPRHIEAIACHPRGPISLLQCQVRRQSHASVNDTDVVEAEESTLEQVVAFFILPINPPGEVKQEL